MLPWLDEDDGLIDRRQILGAMAAVACGASASSALAQGASRITAYGFSFPGLHGGEVKLADYAGRPIMVVNTASLCGNTPQYAGLQQLWTEFRDRGLTIIGVPSNDFGSQEPGGETEITAVAHGQFGVSFPMTARTVVKGPGAHPFYKWAAEARPRDLPRWNFHKYLVGRDGYLAESFSDTLQPTDTRIKTAVARALALA